MDTIPWWRPTVLWRPLHSLALARQQLCLHDSWEDRHFGACECIFGYRSRHLFLRRWFSFLGTLLLVQKEPLRTHIMVSVLHSMSWSLSRSSAAHWFIDGRRRLDQDDLCH